MSMPADNVTAVSMRTGQSRGSMIALVLSLALNALFIGGVISAFARHGDTHFTRRPGQAFGLGAYVSTLPASRTKAILSAVGDRRQVMGPIRRDIRQAREAALAALTADPFDKERFLAAQTQLIETEHRQRLAQRDILVEIAASMTPDERRAYIRWRGDPPVSADDSHHATKQ